MKAWKKNLVAAAVLVTVCAGIYVNWLYTEQANVASLSDTLDYEKVMSEDGLLLTDDVAAITEGEEVSTTASEADMDNTPSLVRLRTSVACNIML